MKNVSFSIGIILTMFVSSNFLSCKKNEDFSKLPAETQSGRGVLGCYVDGELFVNPNNRIGWIDAFYTRSRSILAINCSNREERVLSILIDKFEVNKILDYSEVLYSYKILAGTLPNGDQIYNVINYANSAKPYVVLTRFDTINHVVSGRFEFELKYETDPTKTMKFTQGRFDIKLSMYDN